MLDIIFFSCCIEVISFIGESRTTAANVTSDQPAIQNERQGWKTRHRVTILVIASNMYIFYGTAKI